MSNSQSVRFAAVSEALINHGVRLVTIAAADRSFIQMASSSFGWIKSLAFSSVPIISAVLRMAFFNSRVTRFGMRASRLIIVT